MVELVERGARAREMVEMVGGGGRGGLGGNSALFLVSQDPVPYTNIHCFIMRF